MHGTMENYVKTACNIAKMESRDKILNFDIWILVLKIFLNIFTGV
jgi:hypothetical protein